MVKEEYQTSSEIKNARLSSDIRTLILERLPLFLHEHAHGSNTRIKAEWMESHDHFVVKTFGKITAVKSLNFGDIRLSKTQDASAVAKQIPSNQIQLWVAGHSQVDMYE